MEPEGASSHAGGWAVLGMDVLFGAIGIVALVAAWRLRLGRRQALSWPCVLGRITGSSVSRHEDLCSHWACSHWGQPLGQPLTYDLSMVLTTVDRITAYLGLIPCLRRLIPPLLRTQTDLRPLRLRVSLETHA